MVAWDAMFGAMAGRIEMRTLGEVVRAAREARKWSVTKLAQRTGTQKGYISGIENDRVPPPKAWLVLVLAKLLKLDETDLLLRAHVQKAPVEVRAELAKRCFGSEAEPRYPQRRRSS